MNFQAQAVHDAVETVARQAEVAFLTRSPFHLTRCGGCGGPSFQQPCAICDYYPRGQDKGTWHPKVAALEHFERAVDRSGPGRTGGTLATWHMAELAKRHYRGDQSWQVERREKAVADVSGFDLPSASTIWNVVVEQGETISRAPSSAAVNAGWNGLGELSRLAFSDKSTGSLQATYRTIMQDWVAAAHAGDETAMATVLRRAVAHATTIEAAVGRSGNLSFGVRYIGEALERIEPREEIEPCRSHEEPSAPAP